MNEKSFHQVWSLYGHPFFLLCHVSCLSFLRSSDLNLWPFGLKIALFEKITINNLKYTSKPVVVLLPRVLSHILDKKYTTTLFRGCWRVLTAFTIICMFCVHVRNIRLSFVILRRRFVCCLKKAGLMRLRDKSARGVAWSRCYLCVRACVEQVMLLRRSPLGYCRRPLIDISATCGQLFSGRGIRRARTPHFLNWML